MSLVFPIPRDLDAQYAALEALKSMGRAPPEYYNSRLSQLNDQFLAHAKANAAEPTDRGFGVVDYKPFDLRVELAGDRLR